MSFLERVRSQTLEALGEVSEEERLDYLTEDHLEDLLGDQFVDPEWAPDPRLPEGVETGPQEGLCLYYCWGPVRIGGRWYFKWYMGTPPNGRCVNTSATRVLNYIKLTGYRCGNRQHIYQIGWWC